MVAMAQATADSIDLLLDLQHDLTTSPLTKLPPPLQVTERQKHSLPNLVGQAAGILDVEVCLFEGLEFDGRFVFVLTIGFEWISQQVGIGIRSIGAQIAGPRRGNEVLPLFCIPRLEVAPVLQREVLDQIDSRWVDLEKRVS